MKKINSIKYYTPSEHLVKYLHQKLHLRRKEKELKHAGRELSEKEKVEKENNNRKKTYILDNLIFQSMVDLSYFLQYVACHEELQNVFEDDLKDLFTLRIKKNIPVRKRGFIFEYFLGGATLWDEYPSLQKKEEEHRYNFTPFLYKIISNSIVYGLQHRMRGEYDNELFKIFMNDIKRPHLWITSYSNNKVNYEDLEEEPKRTFDEKLFENL